MRFFPEFEELFFILLFPVVAVLPALASSARTFVSRSISESI